VDKEAQLSPSRALCLETAKQDRDCYVPGHLCYRAVAILPEHKREVALKLAGDTKSGRLRFKWTVLVSWAMVANIFSK
jgi:hypothetical protein